jgi:hypothetical protein
MHHLLVNLIFIAGIGQLVVLVASSLVPLRLQWRNAFQALPRLHRQLYWIYGGYVVLGIIALGLLCLCNPQELASGSSLARGLCLYGFAFWGIRLCLQAVLDVKRHLGLWWLRLGYHTLTLMFLSFTVVYGWAALFPSS